jgi:hypothetical protein
MPANEIDEFGEEPSGSKDVRFVASKVSEKDIFKLAKVILLTCSIFFLLIAGFKIFMNDAKGVSEVWEYSKVFLNSIIFTGVGIIFRPEKRKISLQVS